ncbi:Uncharacterised protein [Slackia heliotrinireducens]|uniref:Uncharacterized protein n=1 Tax=Slackia heliotrinireducens (strain ATCC 29202 / DSM 20476 / NCTC 11029 / RHS 1) TaxID=471855 RepID=C7N5D1_SLAHD|nr:hypothetical protein [Slackia heliotrinireducens]ACV22116.1 hypothetical protein Shel_10810 [Slackia heliotrinireducens DSM 20476]VEH00134.1 Uncharacterised protein [Slackia heliotrinireducens]
MTRQDMHTYTNGSSALKYNSKRPVLEVIPGGAVSDQPQSFLDDLKFAAKATGFANMRDDLKYGSIAGRPLDLSKAHQYVLFGALMFAFGLALILL